MKIFGREPTLVLQALSAGLAVLVTFGFDGLSAEQAALIVAVLSAVLGVANALLVRPVAPAAFTGLIGAVAALMAGYGLELSAEFVGSLSAFTVVVLALFTRVQVTPVADPRPKSDVVG